MYWKKKQWRQRDKPRAEKRADAGPVGDRRQAIAHFECGNVMISANKNNAAVEVKPSEQEKILIITDRRELQAIVDRKRTELEHEKIMSDAAAVAKGRRS